MRLRSLDELTPTQLEALLAAGDRLVFFEYCISCVLLTLRRPSDLYVVRAGDWAVLRGLPYTLVSVLLGWWGLPWGLIYTPLVLLTNLSGGRDVTAEIRSRLQAPALPLTGDMHPLRGAGGSPAP